MYIYDSCLRFYVIPTQNESEVITICILLQIKQIGTFLFEQYDILKLKGSSLVSLSYAAGHVRNIMK